MSTARETAGDVGDLIEAARRTGEARNRAATMQADIDDLVKAARRGDREAARGLLQLVADRAACGRPLDAAISAWLGAGAVELLTGKAASLDAALKLLPPAHREATARDRTRARQVCALVADLLTEWERRTARGGLRYLSVRQAADILATLSLSRDPRQTEKTAREKLRGILADCPQQRRRELIAYLLARRQRVPRGLTAATVRETWRSHRAEYAPGA
ncbi:MAG: hypothetical protein L6Q83_08475 [Gammaproteobacteria bacterium]|nr:hypothetical protein [Gammaproteobacteria bacterium]